MYLIFYIFFTKTTISQLILRICRICEIKNEEVVKMRLERGKEVKIKKDGY